MQEKPAPPDSLFWDAQEYEFPYHVARHSLWQRRVVVHHAPHTHLSKLLYMSC